MTAEGHSVWEGGGSAGEALGGVWQAHARLGAVLEPVLARLPGAELARAGAACRAWRAAVRRSPAWRRLLRDRAPEPDGEQAVRDLARLYEGSCPWRALYAAAAAPWRHAARLTPAPPPARLAAAALAPAVDLLALAADDCSFTVWKLEQGTGTWRQEGGGSVAALCWLGVRGAAWAPATGAPRLLLAGAAPLSAQRGALAVLRPAIEGSLVEWRVAARASGAGGCWAGAAFLSLELRRLSAPPHAPHFATDVWLNAASQEADSEFVGVASRVLTVYNEGRALITQAVCADVPLDERTAREWAEAEAEAEAVEINGSDDTNDATDVTSPLQVQAPREAYYRATYDRGRPEAVAADGGGADEPWVRVAVLAGGGVLRAWALRREAPPPLRVRAGALRDRVQARRARREQEAAAAAAAEAGEGVEAPEPPEPTAAEVRARCDAPAARLRLPTPVLGLVALDNGRAVWASVTGGAVCAALPALRVLRVVACAPGGGPAHYLQPHATRDYFASPVGGCSAAAAVWSSADGGAGARLRAPDDRTPALAVLLPRAACAPHAPPAAFLLTEAALHVFQSAAPRAPPPPVRCADDADGGRDVNCGGGGGGGGRDANCCCADDDYIDDYCDD